MGRRIIEIELNDQFRNHLYFDHYGLLLYCANIVNHQEAIRLYKALNSEYLYRYSNDLPPANLEDEDKVYLALTELPLVVDFINIQVLPYLNSFPQDVDLTNQWGVGDNLNSFLTNQGGFFEDFSVDNIEIDNYKPDFFIDFFNSLKDFFQQAIQLNQRYTVVIS